MSAPRRRHSASASNSRRERRTHTVLVVSTIARPRAKPPVLRTHFHVLRVACWTDQHDSLSPPRGARVEGAPPELGWPPCSRHGRGFRRAACGLQQCVAGNASSLEPLPRMSVSQTAICTFRQALLCLVSRDRALRCSGLSCFRFGLRGRLSPKLCCDSPQLPPLRLAVCLLVSGHFSTQTYL